MKSILSLLFLLAFASCFSQKLVSYKLLPCSNYWEDTYKERIASQRFSHDTLYLEISIKANCDVDLKPTIQSKRDSLFIDLKNVSQVYALCECCYTMLFTITGVQNPSFTLFVNNKEFRFCQSKYISVPPRNIPKELLKNELTIEDLKKGYWKTKLDHGNYDIEYYGSEPSKDRYPLWSKAFNKKGELTAVTISIEGYLIDVSPRMYEEILKEQEAIGN